MKMKSIVMMKIEDVMKMVSEHVEAATRGRVTTIGIRDGKDVIITIEHHDGPLCPGCGGKIHDYGHGLCWHCWQREVSKRGLPINTRER